MSSEYTNSEQAIDVSTSQYDSHEDSSQNDEKHIRSVIETEDSYTIEFGKSDPDTEETADEIGRAHV